MSWKKSVVFLGFIIFLGWLLYHEVDFEKVGEALATFPPSLLAGVLMVSFLILSLKAARFWVLLHKYNVKTFFLQAFKISFAGGVASPLPGGEFFRGLLVKQETKEHFSRISGAVISQSYFETSLAVLIMMTGVVLVEDDFLPYAVGALILVIALATLLAFRQSTDWLRQLLPQHQKIREFLTFLQNLQSDSFEAFVNREKKRPRMVFFELMSLSLVAHLLGGLLLWLIFTGLQVEMSFVASVFIYSTSVVISGIGAIVPGGLGVTEGGLLGLMTLLGVNPSVVVAAILIFRLSTLVFSIVIGGVFFIVFYGKQYLIKWRILSV